MASINKCSFIGNLTRDPDVRVMASETVILEVVRYRSPEGEPTCCAEISKQEVCQFLGVRNFGTLDVCMLGEQKDLMRSYNHFISPHSECSLWTGANKSA